MRKGSFNEQQIMAAPRHDEREIVATGAFEHY